MTAPAPDPSLPPEAAAAWAPHLEPGERLLWAGRPAAGLRFALSDLGPTIAGAVFVAFSIVWVSTAAGQGGPAVLPWLGLLPLAIGVWLLIGRRLWDAYRRARTAYALTDRRALIATAHAGRRLRSLPLSELDEPEARFGPETTIVFFRESPLGQRFRQGPVPEGRIRERPANAREIGFERIPDGERVFGLIRAVRRALAGGAP